MSNGSSSRTPSTACDYVARPAGRLRRHKIRHARRPSTCPPRNSGHPDSATAPPDKGRNTRTAMSPRARLRRGAAGSPSARMRTAHARAKRFEDQPAPEARSLRLRSRHQGSWLHHHSGGRCPLFSIDFLIAICHPWCEKCWSPGIAEYPTRIGCPSQKESLYLLPGINLLRANISTMRSSCPASSRMASFPRSTVWVADFKLSGFRSTSFVRFGIVQPGRFGSGGRNQLLGWCGSCRCRRDAFRLSSQFLCST